MFFEEINIPIIKNPKQGKNSIRPIPTISECIFGFSGWNKEKKCEIPNVCHDLQVTSSCSGLWETEREEDFLIAHCKTEKPFGKSERIWKMALINNKQSSYWVIIQIPTYFYFLQYFNQCRHQYNKFWQDGKVLWISILLFHNNYTLLKCFFIVKSNLFNQK